MTSHRRLANIGSEPAAAGAIPGRRRLMPGVRPYGASVRRPESRCTRNRTIAMTNST